MIRFPEVVADAWSEVHRETGEAKWSHRMDYSNWWMESHAAISFHHIERDGPLSSCSEQEMLVHTNRRTLNLCSTTAEVRL
jgi:hypothetical protein